MSTPVQLVDQLLSQMDIDQLTLLAYERRRAAASTVPQPAITMYVSPEHWALVQAYLRAPLRVSEEGLVGMNVLCNAVMRAVNSGDQAGALFAALRIVRVMWQYCPDLGAIENASDGGTPLPPTPVVRVQWFDSDGNEITVPDTPSPNLAPEQPIP